MPEEHAPYRGDVGVYKKKPKTARKITQNKKTETDFNQTRKTQIKPPKPKIYTPHPFYDP